MNKQDVNKPHVSRHFAQGFGNYYICKGSGVVGTGATIEQAFHWWKMWLLIIK